MKSWRRDYRVTYLRYIKTAIPLLHALTLSFLESSLSQHLDLGGFSDGILSLVGC